MGQENDSIVVNLLVGPVPYKSSETLAFIIA